MCGITGYTGFDQATPILIDGLKKLEYRGYDSAGIAISADSFKICKTAGRITTLESNVKNSDMKGTTGIGHTRWATHGEPSTTNSHPHLSTDKSIAVVHNGIIENYEALRAMLTNKGYKFVSDTDTEVIPNLISMYYDGNLTDAVIKTSKELTGSFAICVMHTKEPGRIIAVKKDSPLIIGYKDKEKYVASDIHALTKHTKNVYMLKDMEFADITPASVKIYSEKKEEIQPDILNIQTEEEFSGKNNFEDYMLKEIFEQPQAFSNTLTATFNNIPQEISKAEKIQIIACGTAYNAGVVGKYVIEQLAKIPVETDIASEYRYRNPLTDKDHLVIAISQSGETADTLAALRLAKQKGAKTLAVTNVKESTLSREADYVLYTKAGTEIAVASTKAYSSQLAVMFVLGIYFADTKSNIAKSEAEKLKNELFDIPDKMKEILKKENEIKEICKKLSEEKNIFFIGRGTDYSVAAEGALKMKEISYIHSEAYPAGELKHGPIAMIEKNTPVIALCTNTDLESKMHSNIKEVIARGAKVTAIVPESTNCTECAKSIVIPGTNSIFSPALSVLPLQLMAYHVSKEKGLDTDKPRNLAKSVTVE